MEGFYVTESQAKDRRMKWPTIPQKCRNPIALKTWGSYPVSDDCVMFPNEKVGWKAAFKQCERNIFERNLTFVEFFAGQRDTEGAIRPGGYHGFAHNDNKHSPREYAMFVLQWLQTNWAGFPKNKQITIETPIKSLLE